MRICPGSAVLCDLIYCSNEPVNTVRFFSSRGDYPNVHREALSLSSERNPNHILVLGGFSALPIVSGGPPRPNSSPTDFPLRPFPRVKSANLITDSNGRSLAGWSIVSEFFPTAVRSRGHLPSAGRRSPLSRSRSAHVSSSEPGQLGPSPRRDRPATGGFPRSAAGQTGLNPTPQLTARQTAKMCLRHPAPAPPPPLTDRSPLAGPAPRGGPLVRNGC